MPSMWCSNACGAAVSLAGTDSDGRMLLCLRANTKHACSQSKLGVCLLDARGCHPGKQLPLHCASAAWQPTRLTSCEQASVLLHSRVSCARVT